MESHKEKKVSRNASPAAFGCEFQVNAAIMLILRNIRDMTSVVIEGEHEDIEVALGSNRTLYCQAKAHFNANCPGDGSTTRLNEAMITLAEAVAQCDCSQVIFATNDPMPFGKRISANNFGRDSFFEYHELEQNQQDYIEEVAQKVGFPTSSLNRCAFFVFHFFGSDESTRYEKVNDAIRNFLGNLGTRDALLIPPEQLRGIWYEMLDFNSSVKPEEETKTVTKKKFIWPLVFELVDLPSTKIPIEEIDEDDWEEAQSRYKIVVNAQSERFDVFTRIATDYAEYCKTNRLSSCEAKKRFFEKYWQKYVDLLGAGSIPEIEGKMSYTCLVMAKVIKKRETITEVKNAVNLRD